MIQTPKSIPNFKIARVSPVQAPQNGDHETPAARPLADGITLKEPRTDSIPVAESERQPKAEAGREYSGLLLYLREIGRIRLLSRQEELELALRHRQGDASARERLIAANLRLVVTIARSYAGPGPGPPLQDLISEGNLGLIRAVDLFDPNQGARLATYASWWIRQRVDRAVKNYARIIRLPINLYEQLGQMRRMEAALRANLGREPTDAELAEFTHVSPERMAFVRRSVVRVASLDSVPENADNGSSLIEMIADERSPSPAETLELKSVAGLIETCLAKLKPREALTIVRRFGLDGSEGATLDAIGLELGMTREGVRRIECRAFKKLRRLMKHSRS
jgi:RNA polymerase primary sigma factor